MDLQELYCVVISLGVDVEWNDTYYVKIVVLKKVLRRLLCVEGVCRGAIVWDCVGGDTGCAAQ